MASIPFDGAQSSRDDAPAARGDGIAAGRLLGFGSLAIPLSGAGLPLVLFIPQLYASHFGLSLATIGFIFFLGRFWDVASDPIVGTLSDRTRTRFGRRRPWIDHNQFETMDRPVQMQNVWRGVHLGHQCSSVFWFR